MSWDELPVVVTVAPVGAEVARADNPALPHAPAEIAADVVVGRHQHRILGLAILHGAGGVRVGFEDGVYLRRGVLAGANDALVADACELVRSLGRRPKTIDEARELLACPVR